METNVLALISKHSDKQHIEGGGESSGGGGGDRPGAPGY